MWWLGVAAAFYWLWQRGAPVVSPEEAARRHEIAGPAAPRRRRKRRPEPQKARRRVVEAGEGSEVLPDVSELPASPPDRAGGTDRVAPEDMVKNPFEERARKPQRGSFDDRLEELPEDILPVDEGTLSEDEEMDLGEEEVLEGDEGGSAAEET